MAVRYVVGAALGLVLLMASTAGPAAAEGRARQATPPPALTGQVLAASQCCFLRDEGPVIVGNTTFPPEICDDRSTLDQPLDVSFSASGPATDTTAWYPPPPAAAGPYGGTYDLTATMTLGPALRAPEDHPRYYRRDVTALSGTFHIRSAAGVVDGVMQLVPDSGATLECWLGHSGEMTVPIRYTAFISASGGGLFQDIGEAVLHMYYHEDPLIESLTTTFTSDLVTPQPLLTQRRQCMNGGWRSYQRLANQGDCIRLVQNGP